MGDEGDRWKHRKILSDHLSIGPLSAIQCWKTLSHQRLPPILPVGSRPLWLRVLTIKLGFTIYGKKFSSIPVAVMINESYSFLNDFCYLPFEEILQNFQRRWNTLPSFNYKIVLLSCNKFCEPILAVTDSMLIIQAWQQFFLLALQFRVSNRTIRFARTTVPRPNISTPSTTVTGWRRPMVRRTMDP